jgi:hypothetical protein
MSIEAPHSEAAPERKSRIWFQRFGATLGGIALWGASLLGIDAAQYSTTRPSYGPTTSVVDKHITNADNPQEAAKVIDVDPALIEKCRDAKFVVINLSGTGMETSHYAASVLEQVTENLGGCSMYHWYGSEYNPAASADSIEKAVEEVTPTGTKKQVVLIGASFGGIAAEDIASEPAIENSNTIELKQIIMLATPMDMSVVTENFFGIPITWVKNLPIPEFGKLPVLVNSINGQWRRGQLFDQNEWNNTFINTAKTDPGLMRSQLQRIQQGLRRVRPDVHVAYAASPDSDPTVDNSGSYGALTQMLGGDKVVEINIPGGGHDEGWLASKADLYNSKIFGPLLEALFGKTV